MGVAFTVKFLFGEFMLELADLIEYTFIFAIFDGREDGVIHNFDEDAVFPENLTFLKGEDDDSGVFDRLDYGNEEIFDVVQIDELFG